MKRRNFITLAAAAALGSCARHEQRQARYDPKDCPFCVPQSGVCNYCGGDGSCTYCNGTGTRKTTTSNLPDPTIKSVTYEEKCPYCKGSGKCRYCDGSGVCRTCGGTGEVENWDFHDGDRS